MFDFSISAEAGTKIAEIFFDSAIHNPVAVLYEHADPKHLFDEVKTSVQSGMATKEEISSIARARFAEIADQLTSTLMVAARQRSEFEPEHLINVGTITLVLSPYLARLLNGYCLGFKNGCFYLYGADDKPHTLLSLTRWKEQGLE